MPDSIGLWLIDVLLVWVALEGLLVVVRYHWFDAGPAPSEVCWNLLAGASLMEALRGVLSGQDLSYLAACLALAGVGHGLDLRLRLRRRAASADAAAAQEQPLPLAALTSRRSP